MEVNAAVHSEISAVPDQRLMVERGLLRTLPSLRPTMRLGVARKVDELSTVRIGAAGAAVASEEAVRVAVPPAGVQRRAEHHRVEVRARPGAAGRPASDRYTLLAQRRRDLLGDLLGSSRFSLRKPPAPYSPLPPAP